MDEWRDAGTVSEKQSKAWKEIKEQGEKKNQKSRRPKISNMAVNGTEREQKHEDEWSKKQKKNKLKNK